jgi:hypothetical protein
MRGLTTLAATLIMAGCVVWMASFASKTAPLYDPSTVRAPPRPPALTRSGGPVAWLRAPIAAAQPAAVAAAAMRGTGPKPGHPARRRRSSSARRNHA